MTLPKFYHSILDSFATLQSHIQSGISSRKSEFRTINLCYIDNQIPFCRTVVIRDCAADMSYIQCHSDYRSPKISAITKHNHVALHCYAPLAKIQLSINATACVHYNDAITQLAWKKTQELSKHCYLTPYAPGHIIHDNQSVIHDSKTNDIESGYQNFCVLRMYIQKIDWLFLHKNGNKRILFTKDNDSFKGQWINP